MSSLFPALVAQAIADAGCHASVADKVYHALCELPAVDSEVLWLRLLGRSYRDIGETLDLNHGWVWQIINGRVKRSVYSIIEHSTAIPLTMMVS